MRTRGYVLGLLVGVAVAALVPSGYRLVLGFVLGYAFSVLYLRSLRLRVDGILQRGRVGLLAYLGSLLGLSLLGCPLLLSLAYPRHLSWAGALVGLLWRKARLYVDAFRGGPTREL